MKQFKKIIPFLLVMTISAVSIPLTAKADSAKVVTLGANLSDEQKNSMYEYFGTSAEEVETIEVNNADERKYMEGIATEAQIGTRTYSCSYVEPTENGGIQVKVANLTFVTSSMIASTLLTSGVENCNVVAASPIEVSGTGALTGIMMAYETASGEELDEDQKATATEELITTGELADTVGQQEATELMNEVKQDVIEDGLTDPAEIQESINDAASDLNITLTEDQMNKIVALMQKISQYDYDVNALKDTLDNLEGKSEGFFSKIWSSIKGFFSGDDSDGGIINNTNDALLGDNAVIDSTLDAVKDKVASQDGDSLWDKIVNFFKNLFGGDDDDQATINAPSDDTGDADDDAATADSGNTDTSDSDTTDSVPSDDTTDDAGEDLTINTEE
ncbi:DUF1002 domain-containing protein [Faecalicatena contorta]|uniref:DUF1002 domain-containing protein n=1 Tax=Faecalicatena contorta TaxID=39482 RepID=UPI001F2BD8BB|nr:DUF1002 domain-containing protein [Faecalicatena contorta]MCF2553918.1 DUF1002 domain-containing protein [Faecalicatena contorta]